MAQENIDIPDQISWTKDTKEQTYRGTMVTSRLNNDALNFSPQTFNKNAARSDAISFPSDISGDAIDISFNPVIQPQATTGYRPKQPEPIIYVVPTAKKQSEEYKNNSTHANAPLYDGFQPHYAHHSNCMDPTQMQDTVQSILIGLQENGLIDFYQKSPFVYAGRAYGLYDDCEFLLSIFSDEISQCIVEIRRSSGESFEYANIENSILKELLSKRAISASHDHDNDHENDNEESLSEDNNTSSFGFGFGFGFASLPSLDSMELDSNFSGTDEDDDDSKCSYFQKEMDLNKAQQLVQNAVDLQSMRDVLRSDIAHLNEQMAKNEHIFKTVPHIIQTINNAINDDFYDCWGIKMYLGMISKLISCSAPIPSTLFKSVSNIKVRWSHMVINEVAPGVKFEFYPSQQIVRCCDQIMHQIN